MPFRPSPTPPTAPAIVLGVFLAVLGLPRFTPTHAVEPPGLPTLTPLILGEPPSGGTWDGTDNSGRIQATGSGLGGRADQGVFAYTSLGTHDFDVQVRVERLDPTALSARAGLMVRDQPTHSSAMAAIVVTPGHSGVQFLIRSSPDANTAISGYFPGNIPNAWLRLQRSNDTVRGLASTDGRHWTLVGRTSLALTNALLGLAASSARTNLPTTAVFTDWADATGEDEDPLPPVAEPPGPSSRRTALALTEIHYNPPGRADAGEPRHQFVELFNSDFVAKELAGHRLESATLRFVFPTNAILGPGEYLVVARDPDALRAAHPSLARERVLGPWTGDLDRDADTLQLWSPHGALLLEVPYTDQPPWPLAPDGEGHTLVLARPSWGEGDPRAWAASQQPLGSPGRPDSLGTVPQSELRIVEIRPQSIGTAPAFVEIQNLAPDPTPLRGLVLAGSVDAQPDLASLPDRTLLPGERLAIELPPATPRLPSPLFLRNAAGGTVWDGVLFGSDTNAVYGRTHPQSPDLRRLTTPTPGQPNAPARRPRLVIAEVMYQPLTGRDDDQFLEVWNPGSDAISLRGWRIEGGIEFTFPTQRTLAPGERAVVARNAARLQSTYPNLPASRVLGEFAGRLSARGERLALLDDTSTTEFAFTYRAGGEWPSLADGGGSSLELLHPELDPDLGSSWAASDESSRAAWNTYEVTGLLENGTGTVNDVRVLLLGSGETLVDDIQVLAAGNTNFVVNAGFESGLGGWTLGGTHERSTLATNGGFGGSTQALHLRAAGRGDNGINSARSALRTGLRPGTNTTLRLNARWLAGTRDLLLRVKGNYLELPVRLDVPEDLGTPGLPNSRSLPAARPALADLSHFPILPAEDQPVRVTVRVSGDRANLVPTLRYRLDPSTDLAPAIPMNDAGLDGDRVPGDGLFTAILPGAAARSMAAFHVTLGQDGSEFRLPRTNPGREALVRWGELQPAGNLGTYRIWITRATESRWSSRARLHNGDLDATFVYGASRAVYGLGTLYSGSPFVSPGYNGPAGTTLCGYVLHFPEDEPFLGEQDFVMDWPIRDDTRQLEQRAYEFAAEIGLPYLHRRFIHFFVNSAKRGPVYEDTQQPGSAYLRNWSPGDDDGSLHKIEDWFEFSSSGEREFNEDARLEDFRRSDGSKNTARYRWNFRPRAVQNSAHDFSDLFRLVNAAVQFPGLIEYQRDLEREMDFDGWAGIFAVEHAVGNWDSFGYSRGKNMYAYRPNRGPWRLYMWDIDFVMSAGGDSPGNWPFATIDPTISQLYQFAPFQRAYWRAVKKLVHGPMLADRFAARVEAVRLGLIENGVSSTTTTSARNYVRDQRNALLAQLNDVDRPFSLTSNIQDGRATDAVLRLDGQGPLEMHALRIDGQTVEITWYSPDRWYATVPLDQANSSPSIVPVDRAGRELTSPRTLAISERLTPIPDERKLVFNEIHTLPRIPGAAFVELHNPTTSQSIDLSGLQLVGAGTYQFPPNTTLAPQQFLVLASTYDAFQLEFGRNRYPNALLTGALEPQGGTLGIVRPARGTNPAVTVTAVSYRELAPWPSRIPGKSLQLLDGSRGQDDRVGLWTLYSPPTNASPWKEFSVTGTAGGTNLLIYVSSFPPSLAPNDLAGYWTGNLSAFGFSFTLQFSRGTEGALAGQLIGGTETPDPDTFGSELTAISIAADGALAFTWNDLAGRFSGRLDPSGQRATGTFTFNGGTSPFTITRQLPSGNALVDDLRLTRVDEATNLIRNGDFLDPLAGSWRTEGGHRSSSRVELAETNPDGSPVAALRVLSNVGGNGSVTNAVSQALPTVTPGTRYRLTGRYQATQARALVIGLEGGPRFVADLRPRTGSAPEATPGRPNSVAESRPPVPLLWINEIQTRNASGPRTPSGRNEPWLEIHNSDSVPAPLEDFFLADDPLTPRRWAFPAGTTVPAQGFLVVWLDGQTSESTPDSPHAGFRPAPDRGVVLLSRTEGAATVTVDFLRYAEVPADRSYGHFPDAWVHADDILPIPTPAASNRGGIAPPRIAINEWMASNDGSFRDPADQDSDDWFELHNAGNAAVDLQGWSLTDSFANPGKFRIPAGYVIPPGGRLLVWADEETGQNQPDRPDLHVNFRLSGNGEEIALFLPEGTLADHVVFGAQTPGISQGRRPDAAPGTNYVFFPSPTPGRSNEDAPVFPPDIVSIERRPEGLLRLRFVAQPGARYRLRTKASLEDPAWIPTQSTATASSAIGELDWPHDDSPHRFLQVERLP